MAKRKVKKAVKQADEAALSDEEYQADKKQKVCLDQDVECRVPAIRAICDMETEHLLTGVRLLRSYFNAEQLQVTASQFFKENLPNVSVVKNGEGGHFYLQWKDIHGNCLMQNHKTADAHMSLLHSMSTAYPAFSGTVPSFGGLQFSCQTGRTSLGGASMLSTGEFLSEDPWGTQRFGMQDGLQTPGVYTPRLSMMSIGMTPKSQRQPKPGEMLLSVHGSPLGVYKEENNMEAIHESDED